MLRWVLAGVIPYNMNMKIGAFKGYLATTGEACDSCSALHKNPLDQMECSKCDGLGYLRNISINFENINDSYKNKHPENVDFQVGEAPSWTIDLKEKLRKRGKEPRTEVVKGPHDIAHWNLTQSKDGPGVFFKRLLYWLLLLILLIFLGWLVYKGIGFYRKKMPNIVHSVKQKRSGNNYRYNPAVIFKYHNEMDYDQLEKNRSLQQFMKNNLKRGKRRLNLQKMSEKGVFHVCKGFGKYARACRDHWFRNRAYRQSFVKRIEQIYKAKGVNIYD